MVVYMKPKLIEAIEDTVTNYVHRQGTHFSSHLHKDIMELTEISLIKTVLELTEGNRSQAAKILGISRSTLLKKINQQKQ